jgi:NAD(P)-dependent dehydrogenase (short-subunit alcohol dehydrogenase family)
VSEISSGTVLITGPTGGLGRPATMAMASRPAGERPDLLLIGRPGNALAEVAAQARAAGATAREVGCDLASLAGVHAAAETVKELLKSGVVRPLRALIAGAGLAVLDTRGASADGYEITFAVNYLAHAQLIGDLLDSFATPARIVLVGSNTYYANWVRRLLRVPEAEWRDPLELAKPAGPEVSPTFKASGVAYSNSKLAILYYAHELQRRAPEGINVAVFEPGFMPGTGLSREHGPGAQRMGERSSGCLSLALPRRRRPGPRWRR